MQFTETKGSWLRGEEKWMARATSSLPVPDSPVMSTVARLGPARSTRASMSRMARLRPMIWCLP